MAEQTVEFF